MVPNGFPPIPIPGVSKSLLPGGTNFLNKMMIFYDFNGGVKESLIDHLKTNNNLILGVGWNKYWSLLPPSTSPFPASAKVSFQGAKQFKKQVFDYFYEFYQKTRNIINESLSN